MKFVLVYVIVLLAFFANEVLSKSKSKKTKPPKKGGSGFCKNKVLSNGKQLRNGSCSTTIQGDIPAASKMTSSFIVFPNNEQELFSNRPFSVNVAIDNLETGFFSDPETVYNVNPQKLNKGGLIQGHSHVTIQELSGLSPPNAEEFVFFEGLNKKAEKGILVADVVSKDGTPGLPAGKYRICTMSGSFTHQPLVMPVAKRGAQDDCIRITVKQGENKDEKKDEKKGKKKDEKKDEKKGEKKGKTKDEKKGEKKGKTKDEKKGEKKNE